MDEGSELAFSIVKKWFAELDAFLIATEDKIIYWGNPTGLVVEKDWEIISVNQTSKLIKSTHTPFHLMKFIEPDLIRASAQELDRVYIKTVKVKAGETESGSFNLNQKHATTIEQRIVKELLLYIRRSKQNMLLFDADWIIQGCLVAVGKAQFTAIKRNKYLNELIGYTDLIYAKGIQRTAVNGQLATVIRHARLTGAKQYNEIQLQEVINEILKLARATTQTGETEQWHYQAKLKPYIPPRIWKSSPT